jgi:chemotaxis family two-component system response regulator Rcp1
MNQSAQILQVEDSPEDRMMTAEAMLEVSLPADLRCVATVTDALKIFSGSELWRPNLVLLDLSLPGASGFSLLRFIKDQAPLQRLPVIIFSSSTAALDVDQAYRLQANCYVAKPADYDHYLTFMTALKEFWLAFAQLPSPLAVNP